MFVYSVVAAAGPGAVWACATDLLVMDFDTVTHGRRGAAFYFIVFYNFNIYF